METGLQQTPQQQPAKKDATVFLVLGWVFTALTLFFLPYIFGPLAIIFGALAIKRGAKTQGIIIIVLSALFLVLALVVGAILAAILMGGGM